MKVQIRRRGSRRSGCLICGKPVVYSAESVRRTCKMCGLKFEANAVCENGHYVCDKCHAQNDFLKLLRHSSETDPIKLFLNVAALRGVHMHGPEHHSIVPCVMLAAYRNNGGKIDLDKALETAVLRGSQLPGGICGFWGACGAAVGAGIFVSIVSGATPLNPEVWSLPQLLTSSCLKRMAEIGGPRCCKRTSRIALEEAAGFAKEHFDIEIPVEQPPCTYRKLNRECIHSRCPYF